MLVLTMTVWRLTDDEVHDRTFSAPLYQTITFRPSGANAFVGLGILTCTRSDEPQFTVAGAFVSSCLAKTATRPTSTRVLWRCRRMMFTEGTFSATAPGRSAPLAVALHVG
jgi:hypothetical protein